MDKEFTGVPDVDRQILLLLPDSELATFCQSNKIIQQICDDDDFWLARIQQRFSPEAIKFKPANISYKQQYKDLVRMLQLVNLVETNFYKIKNTDILTRKDLLCELFLRVGNENLFVYNLLSNDMLPSVNILNDEFPAIMEQINHDIIYSGSYVGLLYTLAESATTSDTISYVSDLHQRYKHEPISDRNLKGSYVQSITKNNVVTLKWFLSQGIEPTVINLEIAISFEAWDVVGYFINYGLHPSERSVRLLLNNAPDNIIRLFLDNNPIKQPYINLAIDGGRYDLLALFYEYGTHYTAADIGRTNDRQLIQWLNQHN